MFDISEDNTNKHSSPDTLFNFQQKNVKPKKYVAKVLLDLSIPHMDRLFDYEILFDNKEIKKENIKFGVPVTVPFSNRNVHGWIIDHYETDEYPERILKIKSINSKYGLLTPEIYNLSKKIAKRYVTNTSEIVKLAVQSRQIRVEKNFKTDFSEHEIRIDEIPVQSITQYTNGESFLNALEQDMPVKATLTLKPYFGSEKINWIYSILLPTLLTIKNNKQVIILFPTKKQCQLVQTFISKYIGEEQIAILHSEDLGSNKYKNYLKILTGQAKIILGTQNAVFAPAKDLGLIICFDDANLNYQSRKSPYINIRQIAIQRSIEEKTSLILAGFNKSIYMRQLEKLKWAIPLEITPQNARKSNPKIVCTNLLEKEITNVRISSFSYEAIKKGLEKGPVLIQVPTRGYYSKIICSKCFNSPKCVRCKRMLSMQENRSLTCTNCAKIFEKCFCNKCGNDNFKAIKSGDNKTAHDLGKVFPSVPILMSNSSTPILEYIDDRPRIVIATPGSEPIPINGYVTSVILDIDTIYDLPAFWSQTESFRRWYNIAGMTKQSGTVVIDGNIETDIATNIQTWNINKILDEILLERKDLDLPPLSKFVTLFGNHQQVKDAIKYIEENGYETLGLIPKRNNEAMTICKSSISESTKMLELLKQYMTIRSLKKLPKLRIQVDPIELW